MRESIEIINRRLIDVYGSESNLANWRVVWSPDQFEDRYGTYEDHTPEGIFLRRVTEVRHVPKYRQYIDDKWLLEALVQVPPVNVDELRGVNHTYECMHAFPYHQGRPLVPIWPALKLLIDTVNAQVGVSSRARYKDPMADPKIAPEVKEARLRELEEELYGNETDVGDALAYRQGVGYTGAPETTSTER